MFGTVWEMELTVSEAASALGATCALGPFGAHGDYRVMQCVAPNHADRIPRDHILDLFVGGRISTAQLAKQRQHRVDAQERVRKAQHPRRQAATTTVTTTTTTTTTTATPSRTELDACNALADGGGNYFFSYIPPPAVLFGDLGEGTDHRGPASNVLVGLVARFVCRGLTL